MQAKALEIFDIDLVAIGRPALDLARPESVYRSIIDARPEIVISAAAFTAVDQAEEEPARAFAINAAGAEAVALAARDCGAAIIHLSTDYVFRGDSDTSYTENHVPAPLNVYGRSKLEGERLVARANPKHVVLRTAWVYSPFGKNFVKTMLALATERDSIQVVADQWGNPTSAYEIAVALLHIAERILIHPSADHFGLYHLAGDGDVNWSGFAREIFAQSQARGGASASVIDIRTAEFPTKARRPQNSRLNCEKFGAVFNHQMPDWKTSLGEVLDIMRHSPAPA